MKRNELARLLLDLTRAAVKGKADPTLVAKGNDYAERVGEGEEIDEEDEE
jgi:hypothetical protein